MTLKKIFAFTMAFLLIAGSVLSVSAETPPYSESFKDEVWMLDALSEYAEQYPNYNGYTFNSDIPKGYHMEYRQVLSVGVGISAKASDQFSFMESRYGQGIDTTFEALYYKENSSDTYRAFVYYGYTTDEVLQQLENAKKLDRVVKFEEGTANGYPYLVCEYDYRRTDYYLAVNEYLIHLITYEDKVEGLIHSVGFHYTDVRIPVKIKDNADWFDKTVENGYVIGDVNADKVLNIRDATALQKYVAKLGKVDKLMADFNGDLDINVKDATDIQKKLAGLDYTCRREKYPVTFDYKNVTDMKLIEATMDNSGPLASDALIQNYDTPDVERYTTVIDNVDEFKAFFGKTLDKYDEKFFEENSLVYLYRWYLTSSIKYVPDGLAINDGVLYISAFSGNPDGDLVECAFGNYNIFIEVNKTDIEGIKGVVVSEYTVAYDD